jgi:phage terminase large subunit GpA-like protein
LTFAAQALQWDADFFAEQIALSPVDPPPNSIADWIQDRRVMPASTPFPGFWDNDKTPYWVEVMEALSPSSPIKHVALLKASQLGASAIAENVIAFYMGAAPAEILYVSATVDMLKKWAAKRLEPLVETCDLRRLMTAGIDNPGNRRSGDLILSKQFIGGALDMASAQSAPSLRSDSKRILIRDEIDGARAELTTGEGNWLAVSAARTNAWGDRAKIFDLSTPTVEGKSLITDQYSRGDKRKYLVPCPRPGCGKYQVLQWGNERSNHGIRPEYKAGKLVGAYYICEHCHDAFFNHEKASFLSKGRWEATKKTDSDNFASYHLSGLYRPIGMISWLDMWKKYETARDDPEEMRGFVNLELGLPFKEIGARPKAEHVIELKGGYRSGDIPDGVLFLTAGIDVQRGSKKDPANPPRLEMEILGHGSQFRTWSIKYLRIEGDVDDENSGAWAELAQMDLDGKFKFKRDDGLEFGLKLVLIDSGDGDSTDTVYKFCSGWTNTYPSKGFRWVKVKKEDPTDKFLSGSFHSRYKQSKVGGNTILYTIGTVLYKTQLYKNLSIKRSDTGESPPGFCAFPADYSQKFFDMLTAEEKLSDGSYDNYGRRNEALDCRVMNLCAGDIYLAGMIDHFKDFYRERGWNKAQLTAINHTFVLKMMEAKIGRKIK